MLLASGQVLLASALAVVQLFLAHGLQYQVAHGALNKHRFESHTSKSTLHVDYHALLEPENGADADIYVGSCTVSDTGILDQYFGYGYSIGRDQVTVSLPSDSRLQHHFEVCVWVLGASFSEVRHTRGLLDQHSVVY
jgi:hypothetical protein